MSRQEAGLFFRLVSYGYGSGAIMMTTNKSVRDWTEHLAGDEVLTTAILDPNSRQGTSDHSGSVVEADKDSKHKP